MFTTTLPELLLIDQGARAAPRTAVLARHGNVVSTSRPACAAELLHSRPVDVIITEDTIADGTAVDVCRTVVVHHQLASSTSAPSWQTAPHGSDRVGEHQQQGDYRHHGGNNDPYRPPRAWARRRRRRKRGFWTHRAFLLDQG